MCCYSWARQKLHHTSDTNRATHTHSSGCIDGSLFGANRQSLPAKVAPTRSGQHCASLGHAWLLTLDFGRLSSSGIQAAHRKRQQTRACSAGMALTMLPIPADRCALPGAGVAAGNLAWSGTFRPAPAADAH